MLVLATGREAFDTYVYIFVCTLLRSGFWVPIKAEQTTPLNP